jgi:hypothetical protein
VEALLKPHQNSHPISYNHYFTETLQKIRDRRREREVDAIVRQHLGVSNQPQANTLDIDHRVDIASLIRALSTKTEPDMDRFAASEALDCMEAYYKVCVP